jgi:hypothetical protein
MVPSEEETTPEKGAPNSSGVESSATAQWEPKSDEAYNAKGHIPTSLAPSAEDAMPDQFVVGALVAVQLAPELVEV